MGGFGIILMLFNAGVGYMCYRLSMKYGSKSLMWWSGANGFCAFDTWVVMMFLLLA